MSVITTNVLFVCLGNICRSPTAEGIFKNMINAQGLEQSIYVDSAGTSNYHLGNSPDNRAIVAAQCQGYDLSSIRARQIETADFDIFHYIIAMDNSNLAELKCMMPKDWQGNLSLMLDFDLLSPAGSEVPDPYLGGVSGFDMVINMLERSCQGLLDKLLSRNNQSSVM